MTEALAFPEDWQTSELPAIEPFVFDRFGMRVDTMGRAWRLNDPARLMVLNWDTGIHSIPFADTRQYAG